MPNTFITLQTIARRTLPRLRENLVMPMLCARDYNDTYSDLGDTIQIRKPVVYEAKDFTVGGTVTPQDIKEDSALVKLDKIATVDVDLNILEAANNWSEDKLRREFIEPAAVALAEKINKAGVEQYVNIPNILGTAGTTPSAMSDLAAARKFLNKAKAPMGNRYAVWDVEADAKFTEIANLFKVNEAGTTETLREGEIGRVYGLDNFMTQAIEQHTPGATGSPAIDGAATKGATTIHIDGLTTAFTVGDTFKIASDNTVYTVNKVGTLSSGEMDVDITPALQANAADDATITVGAAATNNLVFHRDAIVFVTRPLPNAPGNDTSYVTSDGEFSLRIVLGYDMAHKKTSLSMDVLYNYAVVYPEIAARYLG